MNLGDYIDLLKIALDRSKSMGADDTVLCHGIVEVISWRGSYDEIALVPGRDISISKMLDDARNVVGTTLVGYKGGEYLMTKDTPVNIENYGEWTDGGRTIELINYLNPLIDTDDLILPELTKVAIELMLGET